MAAKKRKGKKRKSNPQLAFLAKRVARLEAHAGISHRTKKQKREDSVMHGIGMLPIG